MYKLYAVGVMKVDLENDNSDRRDRLWFFFANFEDAEKCVLQNETDIFEYYYNLALIEEHHIYDPQDIAPPEFDMICAKQWWYEAEYPFDQAGNSLPIVVSKIEQPKRFKSLVNFWAG